MSAAATAAGYLYASGRLRGRNKEGENDTAGQGHDAAGQKPAPKRRTVRVAALPPAVEQEPAERAPAPARTVRVQYRTRRWRPNGE